MRLPCTFSGSRYCMPISIWAQFTNINGEWEVRASELTKFHWQKRGESSLHWWSLEWGHSLRICTLTHTEEKGVSLSWQNSQKPLAWGTWIHSWRSLWQWRYKSLLRMFLTCIHEGNTNDSLGSIVHATEIAHSRDCTLMLHNSRLVHSFLILGMHSAISRLCNS